MTKNQIVSFLCASFLCFFVYSGFESISRLPVFFGTVDDMVKALGIDYHYASISRGLIETKDLIYFLSAIIGFLACTKTALQRRKW